MAMVRDYWSRAALGGARQRVDPRDPGGSGAGWPSPSGMVVVADAVEQLVVGRIDRAGRTSGTGRRRRSAAESSLPMRKSRAGEERLEPGEPGRPSRAVERADPLRGPAAVFSSSSAIRVRRSLPDTVEPLDEHARLRPAGRITREGAADRAAVPRGTRRSPSSRGPRARRARAPAPDPGRSERARRFRSACVVHRQARPRAPCGPAPGATRSTFVDQGIRCRRITGRERLASGRARGQALASEPRRGGPRSPHGARDPRLPRPSPRGSGGCRPHSARPVLSPDFPVLSAGPTPRTSLATWDFTITGEIGGPPLDLGGVSRPPRRDVHKRHPLRHQVVEAGYRLGRRLRRYPPGRHGDDRRLHRRLVRRRLHHQPAAVGGDRRQGLGRLRLRRPAAGARARRAGPTARPPPLFLEERQVGPRPGADAEDRPGFWEQLGYHNFGDPWREQRYWGD